MPSEPEYLLVEAVNIDATVFDTTQISVIRGSRKAAAAARAVSFRRELERLRIGSRRAARVDRTVVGVAMRRLTQRQSVADRALRLPGRLRDARHVPPPRSAQARGASPA